MTVITASYAQKALIEAGYPVKELHTIEEGSNHFVFIVVLHDTSRLICKFAKVRKTEQNIGSANRDTLFGGLLSLEREAYLFSMIRDKAEVPTPKVYGIHRSEYGTFIVLEYMTGISQKEYMKQSVYSKQAFLNSMEYLGRDFAKIQQVTFPSFGNIMENSIIDPSGLTNFSDRFRFVIQMRLDRCIQKHMFSEKEISIVSRFFKEKLDQFRPHFEASISIPVLNFTDMHAENFYVDHFGKPSGYFDLESAQAAPAALEFYGFRFFLFNFYDEECFKAAEGAFFRGYQAAGGLYTPTTEEDGKAIDFLAGCRLLELAQSYWGYKDGVRDLWGEKMKNLLFAYIETEKIDYMSIGDIWRERDHQPPYPLTE